MLSALNRFWGFPMVNLPRIEPALRAPLISAALGIGAASGLAVMLPGALAMPVALVVLGLASLAALLALDTSRRQQADALARNVGELNVRLAATRIKLDGLQSRINSEPLREADIAPTRTALAELTAEVGLLGGVLRDVATAVSDHEVRLDAAAKAPSTPAAREPSQVAKTAAMTASIKAAGEVDAASSASSGLVAEPSALVDAQLGKRDDARLEAIIEAFGSGGLEMHLQPVAALPQRRTVGYEALARLRLADGTLLMPSEFIAALERAGQGSGLDAQVLTQILAIAAHLNTKGNEQFVSLNLCASTWADARALGSVARVLEAFQSQAARLIIEIPQRTFRQLDPARLGIVGGMSARGVRFALDHVSDLRLDPNALADRGIRYIKASASVLAGLEERSPGLDIDVADLALLLRRAGIEMIGEHAESDRLIADLIDLDIRLAQGFAISQPRPVKPDVFLPVDAPSSQTASAVPADNVPLVPPPARNDDVGVAPQRVPFRSVLRRA
jgi:cyclic-di-GMP phosphodiesterase, flagellum assembly factor TipF